VADLATLQRTLGIRFDDCSLLEQALVHGSYINENPSLALTSNERLEFLGDAVLDLVVADKLFQDFPQLAEGDMTRLRATLVRQETLAHIARAVGLGGYLYLGKGEEASGGRDKAVNLAGALEAVIAAVYLTHGLDAAAELVLRLFEKELQRLVAQSSGVDYKSQLQWIIQARYQQPPAYRVIETTGPGHARQFTVEVRIGDEVLGRGTGKSKKLAETEAARSALERL